MNSFDSKKGKEKECRITRDGELLKGQPKMKKLSKELIFSSICSIRMN